MKTGNRPQLLILAGPNGSGKSTFRQRYIEDRFKLISIDPDIIARTLIPQYPNDRVRYIAAGRKMLEQRRKLLREKRSFGLKQHFLMLVRGLKSFWTRRELQNLKQT